MLDRKGACNEDSMVQTLDQILLCALAPTREEGGYGMS
jgi:hypothetical protein